MVSREVEIRNFLAEGKFSKYQRIELPYGLELPGRDNTPKIEAVFKDSLRGRSVLDIGCYYGLYCHEARKRGATRVVGIEVDQERYQVAKKIAEFIDDGVEIVQGDFREIDLDVTFDVILFLSVIHHLRDPIAVIRRLASLCTETLIVEFALPTHRLKRKWRYEKAGGNPIQNLLASTRESYKRALISLIDEHIGVMVTGEVFNGNQYDWTFFMNQTGFRNVFQVQENLFREIEFVPSPLKQDRMIAFCKV